MNATNAPGFQEIITKTSAFISIRIALCAFLLCLSAGCSMFGGHGSSAIAYDGTQGSQVLKTAVGQVGTRYSAGKAIPGKGFDCSGLVWWSYAQHGIKVPRTSKEQSQVGKGVHLKNARQGDIIVFRVGRSFHTGLIADKGRFVHSPSSGSNVRVESYYSDYWKGKVVAVRRII